MSGLVDYSSSDDDSCPPEEVAPKGAPGRAGRADKLVKRHATDVDSESLSHTTYKEHVFGPDDGAALNTPPQDASGGAHGGATTDGCTTASPSEDSRCRVTTLEDPDTWLGSYTWSVKKGPSQP